MEFTFQGPVITLYYDTLYLTDPQNTLIYTPLLNQQSAFYVSGNGININKNKCINSAFGEYFERLTMFDNYKKLFIDKLGVTGISLITEKKLKLTYKDIYEKKLFVDTCGLSSHIQSALCIDNSLNEFIERQSFIYNYLSKSPGNLIDESLYSKFYNIPYQFKGLKFYDISLINGYYVIFSILKKKNEVWLGLGSSTKFKDALLKSIKEIQQFFYSSKLTDKSNNQDKLYNKGDYANTFSKLSSSEVEGAYEYLLDSPVRYIDDQIYSNQSIENILMGLYKKCGIEPFAFFLQYNKYNWIKACHIADVNWFPSLNPNWFPEKVYDFVENKMKVRLDRKCNFIPFP